jgi:hypothetical protein
MNHELKTSKLICVLELAAFPAAIWLDSNRLDFRSGGFQILWN